jgi:hypothetical protein
LLGLLGTVTGMIATFDVLTVHGTDPKAMSGGISEALVTTQLGLMVAIPTLLFGNLLSGWSDSIKSGMEKVALRITNIAHGYRPQGAGASGIQPAVALAGDARAETQEWAADDADAPASDEAYTNPTYASSERQDEGDEAESEDDDGNDWMFKEQSAHANADEDDD